MRVAYLHPRYPSAEGTGATHSATQIVTGLTDAGHDVTVFCTEQPAEEQTLESAERRYLTGVSKHPHTNTRINSEITARVDDFEGFDVIHSYLPSTIPAVATLGERLSSGIVVTLNAYGGVCPKNDLLYMDNGQCHSNATRRCLNCIARTSPGHEDYSAAYRFASRVGNLRLIRRGETRWEHVDAFRAPSAHVRSNYATLGLPSESIHVIPHPIDERFDIAHTSSFSEPIELLYVGYLEAHKGVEKLIPLMASLRESDVEFRLTVVGTGGLESTLRSRATELGVSETVDFTGFVPNEELPAVYANHDCFVYPGVWEEPLARVYLECFATGTPVVTTEYGNIAEIVGDAGRVTDGSVTDFQATLLDVARNDDLQSMSAAATDRAEAFRLPRVINRIESMYETIT
jgi:glycosyltransferase involved in cell wall biosynthesis